MQLDYSSQPSAGDASWALSEDSGSDCAICNYRITEKKILQEGDDDVLS